MTFKEHFRDVLPKTGASTCIEEDDPASTSNAQKEAIESDLNSTYLRVVILAQAGIHSDYS
jgi:hypothetical protein